MKIKTTLLVMAILTSISCNALNYFWVGGSGSWSDFNNHWATTSGGNIFHNQVPQSTDNVYFDAFSFTAPGQTVAVDQTVVICADMDWTGVTHNPTLYGDYTTTLTIYGSLKFVIGMTFNFTGQISFEATTTGKTITTAGTIINTSLTFNGIGGGYTLQDALTCIYGIYLNNGTLSTNNQTVTIGSFFSTTNSTRVLNMGSSIFNLTNPWDMLWYITHTGMTLNSGTSSINVVTTFGDAYFAGGGFTYNNLSFTQGANGIIYDNNIFNDVFFANNGTTNGGTFHDVSFAGNAYINNSTFNNVTIAKDGDIQGNNSFNDLAFSAGYTYTLQSGNTQTITNSLSVNGNCGALINILKSSTPGLQATISKASGTVTVSYVTLKDINATGGGTFTANNAIDLGNNTGWTINTLPSKNLYWVGNAGNWDDGNHWSTTSGGLPSGCSPTPVDNVFFDANSFSQTGQTLTVNAPTAYCYNMDWTGVTNNPTISGINTLKIYGSLTLVPAMTFNFGGILSFEATTTGHTITTAGVLINTSLTFNGSGGGWALQDDLTTPYLIYLNKGSLNTNNQTVNAAGLWSNVTTTRAITTGTSTFNLSDETMWYIYPVGITINASGSTINGTSTVVAQHFHGSGFTYYDLFFTGGTNGNIYGNNTFHNVSFAGNAFIYGSTFNNVTMAKEGEINASNTFNNLTLSPGYTYTLQANQTQTILNSLAVTGNCGALINILKSSTPGSQATIKKTAGAITVSFVTLRDIKATGGASFTANNAIDLGNNTGWTINTLPSKNLYWIGNSGNWDDGNHWSITSGGMASGCSPTPMDNVFFDANSFSLTGQAVTVNAPTAYFNNMDWTGVSHNPALNGSTTIKIYGSLTLAAAMSFNFDGSINFEASSTGKTITTAGIPINTSIIFNGNGGWTLQDELTCLYSIYLNKGTLNTNNQTVNASAFWSNTTDTRALNAGTSTINLSGEYMWYIVPQGMTINASNSTIKGIATGWYQDFYGGGITYNDVLFTAGSIGSLYGNNTFHDASFAFDGYIHGGNFHDVSFASNATINGPAIFNNVTIAKQGDINGNNTFNNLSFSPGYAYTLQAGGTQTVSNICAQGTGALPIRIQSNNAGVAATISKASGTMCWDYVRVSDITGTGGATFNAGLAPTNSEDMGGNTGLLFTGTCTPVSCAPCTSPSITAHPANSTICAGNNFVFTIGATGTGLTYQWQVDQGAGFTNLASTAPYNGVTTNALNITAAATGLNGFHYRCIVIGACAPVRTSNAATLTVNMPPTVNVNSATICSGQTATLSASGATNYVWSVGGMMGDTTNPISVSPITTTTYTVTGITNGCSNTAIATVTVNSLPTVSVNSATICSGETATLTAIGAITYTWSNGATTNIISVSPATTTSYTVTGTGNGCSNTSIATVTVNPLPIITANSATVCSGQTATLTTSGATTYTWSNGATTNIITVSPSSTTSYTVTGATNGCSGTAVATVTVNPLPTVTVNSTTVCLGQTTTLTASGATTYTWSNGATTNIISVSPATTTSYTVTGTSNGCSNTSIATVTVNPLPIITANSATVCSGQTATLTASGATNYTWSNGANTNSITVSPSTTTSYTVTGTTNSCANTAVATVTVNSLPTVSVNSVTICLGQTATLTASGAPTYTWSNGATTNVISVSPASTTSYTITGTTNGCSNTAVATVTVNPLPTVSVNSAIVCSGQTTTLTAIGATTYTWSNGATTNSITVSPSTTTTYTVTGTTNGCSNTAIATVTVNSLPTITVNSATVCAGQTATLTATGATTYAWSNGATTNIISVSPATTASYTVTGTTNGCSNTAIATVTVNPLPTVTALVSSTTITVSAIGGTPPYTGTGTFTGLAQGTYSYSVTDVNGCVGSTTAIVNSLPISNFNISSDTVYVGSSLTITNISTGFSPTTKFAWNFGDICYDYSSSIGTVSGYICIDTTIGSSPSITHTYYDPGTYTITLSAKDVFGNNYSMSKSIYIISSVTSACNSGTNCELVCNGNLEDFNACGNNNLGTTMVPHWANVYTSNGTMSTTPDYWLNNTSCPYDPNYSHNKVPNNFLGCQPDHSGGNAYVGVYTYEGTSYPNLREYVTSTLNTPMITGQYYNVSYWVSLGDVCKYATYAPRAYFTNSVPVLSNAGTAIVAANNRLTNTSGFGIITDKTSWVHITDTYHSISNETQITLGNFSYDAFTPHPSVTPNICSSAAGQYPSNQNGAYYYIDDISVTPATNPIILTAPQTNICNGQNATLTAAGGNGTYSWTSSTSPGIVSTAAIFTIAPTTTTTYTVSSYTSIYGCTQSQSITITVNPLPVLSTSGNSIICSGSSTTLTATGTGTFQWNTGATSSSIIVSPISTTNYTVTLTGAGGCKKTATIVVSVIPKPNFQVSGSAISCEPSSYAVTPTQPGVTYNWSTSTNLSGIGSSTFLNLNPNGGTITFTGTYGGCSSSSSLYVGSCCNPPSNNIPNQVNSNASALNNYGTTTGGVLTIYDRQFSINGIFHVNKNLRLEGCTVTMGYLAKIIVDPGFTLTITDRPDKSHLYACNEMWDGIYLPASSSRLIINNGTTIEDAINAVVSNSKGFFQINSTLGSGNVIFNKNLKSIVVNSALVGGHPGSMSSTTIQCYDGVLNGNPANTNGKLHYPHATKRSDVGVEITSVFDITIGDPSNVAKANTFDNLDNGIRTYNSSVNVYNNNFKKITYTGLPNGECFPGIAICATGLNSFNRTLKVGSNLGASAYRNTFFNCYRGVAAKTYMNVAILNNTFTNISNIAVRMTANYGRSLTVNRNTINYANIGIDSYDNRGSYITINDNVIAAGLFASSEQGIRAGEIVKPSPPTAYNIINNLISNVRWGINASGLSSSFINTNIVNIKHVGGQPCYGISLTNSTMSNVVGNVVKGQNKTDNWVNGIYLNLCNVSTVSCNTSDKLYTGLFFGGALGATSTSIKKNLMNNNFRGLMLSSATVGQQGAVGSPNDNRWTNITPGNYHTYSLNSIGANSKFYVRNATGPYNPSPYLKFAAPTTGFFVPLQPTSGNLNSMTCPVIHSTGGGGGAGSPKAMALQIAGDSIVPAANIASTKWMLKQGLYNYLQTDSSLVSTEPLLAQFKANHSMLNLGKLQATEKILGDPLTYNTSALQTAQTLNNTVSPSSDAETNSQWMNSLLIDNALSSIDFTGVQLTDLRVLAAKCPYSDGTAVFQARTILSQYDTVDYINECEMEFPDNQRSMIIQEQAQDTINTEFKLYPNPNNGNMLLDYSLNATDKGDITIYDIAGKLIYKYDLDASASQIIISHAGFNNGIYFYRIKVNERIVQSDKLIIIK